MYHQVLVSVLLNQRETGSYVSYLMVNFFFYKKLEAWCVVFVEMNVWFYIVVLCGFVLPCFQYWSLTLYLQAPE